MQKENQIHNEVYFIYDGDCPICNYAAHALRIRQKFGGLTLVNAREDVGHAIFKMVNDRGYDLDDGMVIYHDEKFYHGKSALKFMAVHGAAKNVFNAFIISFFWSDFLAKLLYPSMRGTRNWLIRRKRVGKIDNLNLKTEPTFKPIFGDDWEYLPTVIKKHYALRPYSDDMETVEGKMDVSCSWYIKIFAPFLWLMGNVPAKNEKGVPVTVDFRSNRQTKDFYFRRVFQFNGSRPYHFRSRMRQVKDNEVLEIMGWGFCWRMHYLWQDGRVILRHKGYALKIGGAIIPLPITYLLGRGDAYEVPVDDNTFDMSATITHPLFGKVYEYKGRFKFK